jgi:fermentation-respiration switch protein FrsA (DUF1100 family)
LKKNHAASLLLCGLFALAAFGAPAALRAEEKPAQRSVDFEFLAKRFVDRLVAGRHDEAAAMFDAVMKEKMPPDRLEETWNALRERCGPLTEQIGISRRRAGAYTLVFLTCRFEKMPDFPINIQVTFNDRGEIGGFFYRPAQGAVKSPPPAYADPATFREEDVTVGAGEWALPGTLTLPRSPGPHPALVLVHGSGPNDRDETVGPNKPFRDLAWGLATRGIAVLRYDKRTHVHGAKMAKLPGLTVKEETEADALLAAALLAGRAGVNPEKVFVAGHSLGGLVLPRIGAAGKCIAGLVFLAAPARPLEDLLLDQIEYITGLDGKVSRAEGEMLKKVRQQVARVKAAELGKETPRELLPMNSPASYWLDLRGYSPTAAAVKLTFPMLVLQGERDYQVTMKDFGLWKKALGGRANVVLRSYPSLNHLFIPGSGPCTPAEYLRSGHVDEAVVRDLAAWLKK